MFICETTITIIFICWNLRTVWPMQEKSCLCLISIGQNADLKSSLEKITAFAIYALISSCLGMGKLDNCIAAPKIMAGQQPLTALTVFETISYKIKEKQYLTIFTLVEIM